MPGHFPVIACDGRRIFGDDIASKSQCESLGSFGPVIRVRLRRR